MSIKSFCKPTLSTEQQLSLLKKRGLLIQNQELAKQALNTISYYRLSAYCKAFQDEENLFKPNTSFQQIIELYTFDRELRLSFITGIERIEIAFRAILSNVMSHHHGSLWYLETKLFKKYKTHYNFLQVIDDICKNRKEDFLQHFYQQYTEKFPPSWMLMECLSFGTISLLFKNIKSMSLKKQISKALNIPCTILESWLESLVFTRNLCAHHARLWNRWFVFRPKIPNSIDWVRGNSAHSIYEQILIISILLKNIDNKSRWLSELYKLLNKYNAIPKLKMGFAVNWRQDRIWVY